MSKIKEVDNNTYEIKMIDALDEFCKMEGLPNQSIDELLYLDTLTERQRGWLECALKCWDMIVDGKE